MALVHVLSVVVAAVALVVAPFGVLLCLLFPGLAERTGRAVAAIRRATLRVWCAGMTGPSGRHWTLIRFARAMHLPTTPEPAASDTGGPPLVPIAQVAADLRRLNRLRGGVATRSAVWFIAVHRAYDDRLGTACHQLQVEQYLDGLIGVDLDLERLRVEGALREAGLVLDDINAPDRPGPR